jgi:hypothetical protein
MHRVRVLQRGVSLRDLGFDSQHADIEKTGRAAVFFLDVPLFDSYKKGFNQRGM